MFGVCVRQVAGLSSVRDVWRGYHCVLASIGGSGSGKSFTLFGRRSSSVSDGIIQRFCKRLFLLGA